MEFTMFTNIDSNDYSKITPDNKSEVLATQGNVINSIKTFWNNLRTKLAYAISRPSYDNQVGGNYVPIFVDADGVVQECHPTTIQASIAQNGIITIPTNDIPNDNIYTGTTVCISVLNNTGSNNDLQIQHKDSASPVKYPSGVTVQAKDISKGDLLLATFCKTSTSSSNNFWILLNKINTVVSTGQTTSNDSDNGGHPGLMTAEDKAKLDTINWSANNYSLPVATDKTLGGIQLGYITNETNRNYKLQTDNNGNGYVNVPWTVYSLPTANKDTLGGVKSKDTGTISGKDYNVQINSDGTMKVNVPWTDTNTHNTAYLRAGNNTSITNEVTNNGNTYLKIVDGGSKSSSLKILGTGGTEVKSDADGSITISSPIVHDYYLLSSTNNSNRIAYLILGPGSSKANTNYYLAGNGTWVEGILVPAPTSNDYGKTLKCDNNGKIYWG